VQKKEPVVTVDEKEKKAEDRKKEVAKVQATILNRAPGVAQKDSKPVVAAPVALKTAAVAPKVEVKPIISKD